ncbi:MAG: hypothetical protein EOO90_17325 [Pedobacter sp.]|nr:MAG: hypothetical protein EOO90_17325 [Pedobacter sp.]
MAKYSKATFGQISGTVNNAVGSSWRGVNYLRDIAKKNSKGPSPDQLGVQAKMVLAAKYLARIRAVLNIGFADKKLNKITAYNAAVKEFINHAVVGEYPDLSVDYANMKVSKGSLTGLKSVTMTLDGNLLKLQWQNKLDKVLGNADDEVLVLLYNSTADDYMTNTSAFRNDGELTVELEEKVDSTFEVWLFCVSKDRKVTSTSQYLGNVQFATV